jgi:hypothetical protein
MVQILFSWCLSAQNGVVTDSVRMERINHMFNGFDRDSNDTYLSDIHDYNQAPLIKRDKSKSIEDVQLEVVYKLIQRMLSLGWYYDRERMMNGSPSFYSKIYVASDEEGQKRIDKLREEANFRALLYNVDRLCLEMIEFLQERLKSKHVVKDDRYYQILDQVIKDEDIKPIIYETFMNMLDHK